MTDPSGTNQELAAENSAPKQKARELEQAKAARLQAEEALRKSDQRFRAIFNSTFQFTGLMTPDGILIEANQTAIDFAGIRSEDVINRPFWETRWWQGNETRVRQLKEAISRAAKGEFIRYEVELQGAGNAVALFDFSLKPVLGHGREVELLIPEGRDITDRKRAEEALRETQLRAIVESTGNGILAIDSTGRVILSNRKFAEIWNIPPDLLERNDDAALLTYALNQLVNPDAFLEKVRLLYQSTAIDRDRILFKDGRMMERYSYPILNEGVIRGRVWSFRDITAQSIAEKALRNSELLFKNAFSMSPAMMGIHRLTDRKYLAINQLFTQYTGYQGEEIIGHTLDEIGLLEPATLQQLRKIFSEQNRISNREIQYKTKSGELRYALYSAALIDETEKTILSLIYDITERKHSEALLKLREEESLLLAKNLEEANIALRVVLSRREEDQRILEEKIQSNVNEIIIPFIGSLKNRMNGENRDRHYLDLLESNLKSILSPFMRNMAITYKSLTPKETQIAEMIRQGKNSKDIADMLGTSAATINTHRNNIRKKLNMKNQKTNLRSHLLSHS
jgi:PAS domain S-box-containing protein